MGTKIGIPAEAGAGKETTVGIETEPEEKVGKQQAKETRAAKTTKASRKLVGLSRAAREIFIIMNKPPTDQLQMIVFSLISEGTIFLLLLLRLLLLLLLLLPLFRSPTAPNALSAITHLLVVFSTHSWTWLLCGKRRMRSRKPSFFALRH